MLVGPGLGKPESPEGLPLSQVLNGGEVWRREKECVSAQGLTGGRLKEPKLFHPQGRKYFGILITQYIHL